MFNRLDMYRRSSLPKPSITHGDIGPANAFKNRTPSPWYTRQPRHNLPITKNSCRFQILRGVPRPRHTYQEYNYPAHPRHRYARLPTRPKQLHTARLTQSHIEYAQDADAVHTDMLNHEAHHDLIEDQFTYILDSGAHPSHMKTRFSLHNPRPASNRTRTATNPTVPFTHVGQTTIRTNKGHFLHVTAVVSPRVTSNLLSVRSISQKHGNILFTPEVAYIFDKNSRDIVIGTAP